jgi:hypothetical protein
MLMAIDACGHLNSGNVFLRNSPWTRDFFERVGRQTDLLYHIWWENAAIIKLLEINLSDLEHVEITSDHTRFNSYLQGLPNQLLWTSGNFLVHFAGIYDTKKIAILIEAIGNNKTPRLQLTNKEKIEYIE